MYNQINRVKKRVPIMMVDERTMKIWLEKNCSLIHTKCFSYDAQVGPFCMRLITNSPHLALFWEKSWEKARKKVKKPHAQLYALITSTTKAPKVRVCPELREGIIFNTEHYNQVKSLALGFAAFLGERTKPVKKRSLFILGSLFSYKGRGVCLIGPSKTGKTTLSSLFCIQEPEARLIANDPFYVNYEGKGFRMERAFYMRTDIIRHIPECTLAVKNSLLQNADPNFLDHGLSSYCVVQPEKFFGKRKTAHACQVHIVFILIRKYEMQNFIKELTLQEAFQNLRCGVYRYYETEVIGFRTHKKLVRVKRKPYYNSALFYPKSAGQEKLYKHFLKRKKIFLLNTIGDIESTLLLMKTIILKYGQQKTRER